MESRVEYHLPNQALWKKLKTRHITWIVTAFLAWLPAQGGQLLRHLVYRMIFRQLGKAVKIQANVSITDANCIAIGNQVTLTQGSILDARDMNRITLMDSVFLDRDVRISCSGNKGKVELHGHVHLDRGVDIKVHEHGITSLGARTYLGPYVCLSGYGNITIGEDCLIASHTSIYAHNYNYGDPTKPISNQGYNHRGITIKNNCWIGSGVRILDGVTIGEGSIIGAGAVVTKDIPPNSIAVGTPAKVIGDRIASDSRQSAQTRVSSAE